MVGDNQQANNDVTWTQSADSVNEVWARATVGFDTAYDGCGGNPNVSVLLRYQGATVGVFPTMDSRDPTTILDPVHVDHVFWSDDAIDRSLTIRVVSGCGKINVDVYTWIEEVA